MSTKEKLQELEKEFFNFDRMNIFEINLKDYLEELEENYYVSTNIQVNNGQMYSDYDVMDLDEDLTLDENLNKLFEKFVDGAISEYFLERENDHPFHSL